ncbi:MAG: Wadjet anti-phage system protein JetD domain-containing protein [Rhodoferax sp.]
MQPNTPSRSLGHGFAILNQQRAQFAHVVSFLMNRETLNAHKTG